MKLTFPKNARQLMHVASRTPSHARDREENKSRRETVYFSAAAVARASPLRPEFSQLTGIEAVSRKAREWELCNKPDEVGRFLIRESAARAPFFDTVMRHGREAKMRRVDKNPIAIMSVSTHPAASDVIAAIVRTHGAGAGQDALRKVLAKFVRRAERVVSGRRWLIAVAAHTDSDDLHIDCALARNDERGRFAGGLLTVGPWGVATRRALLAGATISDRKRAIIDTNVTKFRALHGDVAPLDAALADAIDDVSAGVLGEDYLRARDAWAARVPAAEQTNALAVLREIEDARDDALLALDPRDRRFYLSGRRKIEESMCEIVPAAPTVRPPALPAPAPTPAPANKPRPVQAAAVPYESVL